VSGLERTESAALRAVLRAVTLVMPGTANARIAHRYLDELRAVRPGLTSRELIERGVPQGPIFGEILRRLRAARLDDPSLTLDAEERLVQHMLSERVGG
jgi:hypothetical protein